MDNGTARYELDLCQSHFDELTGADRRLRSRRRTGGGGSATKAANKAAGATTMIRRRGGGSLDTAAVREWVRAHGYAISDRVGSRVTSWKASPPGSSRFHTRAVSDSAFDVQIWSVPTVGMALPSGAHACSMRYAFNALRLGCTGCGHRVWPDRCRWG